MRRPTQPPAEAPPELAGEEGWTPAEQFNETRTGESYVSGDAGGRRLRVRYFRRQGDGALTGRAWYGPGTQGPPAHAHGGATAALLDEAMGFACWLAGHRVVAVSIQVEFRAMIPLGSVVTLEARVERVEGRKVYPGARLLLPDGTLAAESGGIFLELARDQLDRLSAHAIAAGLDAQAFA